MLSLHNYSYSLALILLPLLSVVVLAADAPSTPSIDFQKLFDGPTLPYPPLNAIGTSKSVWVDAYNNAKQKGLIPDFPPSTKAPDGSIVYPNGVTQTNVTVASWTLGFRSPADISDAPPNMCAVSFDDGPSDGTQNLLKFLKSANQIATHFVIGSQVLRQKDDFMLMVQQRHQIALHTWSHPYLTTLTDLQVLAEIGWNMQIIYDLSKLIPTQLRPPYGDVDNRVRAIVKHVFGVDIVIWNQDTLDWCVTPQDTSTCKDSGPANEAAIVAQLSTLAAGPKSKGLIILQHEITQHSVSAFTKAHPKFLENGWKMDAIASLFNRPWYQPLSGTGDGNKPATPGGSPGSAPPPPADNTKPAPGSGGKIAPGGNSTSSGTNNGPSGTPSGTNATSGAASGIGSPAPSKGATTPTPDSPKTEKTSDGLSRHRTSTLAAVAVICMLVTSTGLLFL